MQPDNDFGTLSQLPEPVLALVIHEAELRLQSQFESAANSDQRALVWTGFLVTIGLAISGLIYTQLTKGRFGFIEGVLCGILVGLAYSTFLSLDCFRPSKFHFPGNLPQNWLPVHWQAGKDKDITQARVEQAACLNSMIIENREWAEERAKRMQLSIDASLFTLGFGILCALIAAAVS